MAVLDWLAFLPAAGDHAGGGARQDAKREIGRLREVPETGMAEAEQGSRLLAFHAVPIGSHSEYLRIRSARFAAEARAAPERRSQPAPAQAPCSEDLAAQRASRCPGSSNV